MCGLVSGGGGGGETSNSSLVMEDDTLNLEEEIIMYQEQLPEPVLSAHSLDPVTMRVLSPSELIYVGLCMFTLFVIYCILQILRLLDLASQVFPFSGDM